MVDIVDDIIRKYSEPFQLVLVDMDDVPLEDHGSYKCTETAHTAVLKLLLDSRHFFRADTDF